MSKALIVFAHGVVAFHYWWHAIIHGSPPSVLSSAFGQWLAHLEVALTAAAYTVILANVFTRYRNWCRMNHRRRDLSMKKI